MNRIKEFGILLKDTFLEWNNDGAPMLAAALSYYTAFSLAPLIIVILALVGLVANQSTVQAQITQQIAINVGPDAALLINDLVDSTSKPDQGIFASLLGIGGLLLGALGVFNNLQTSLDRIWNVEEVEGGGGVKGFFRDKLLSFGMILVIGFLLLVSLVLSAFVAVFDNYLNSLLPGMELLLQIINFLLSFGITTFLFMLIFKFLPHIQIEWRDVFFGAVATSILFTIGKTLIALYLGNSSTASSYGAAGTFVLILLWVYYSAQILLFGAEFTQIYTRRYGSHADKATPAKQKEIKVDTAPAQSMG